MIDKLNATKEFYISLLVIIILWLIFSYFDTFEMLIEYLETHEEYELDEVLLLFIIMGIISTIFAIRRVIESNKINKQLQELNSKLEKKINKAINEKQEQEQILIQQSRLASMGEMIGNIAHQWRQPLNALGLVMQNIKFSYEMGELDDEFMEKSIKKANLLTQGMSKTIDDFRNFFKPNKSKVEFNLNKAVEESLSLVESTFEHHDIKIKKEIDNDIKVFGFPNEFLHSLINILNNSKDAFEDNKVLDRIVTLIVKKNNDYGIIEIQDNAGGIPKNIQEKIFEPYFSTKEEGSGTGIGLYMSKVIIEKNMDGELINKNIDGGTIFSIKIPLRKEVIHEK